MRESPPSQTSGGGDSHEDELERALAERTRDLRAALDQRSSLLHELDHRVKNNLQLISSLMLLQARHASDPQVRRALNAMLERLNAISTVHRRLFQSEGPDRFDIAAFARDLVSDVAGSAGRPEIAVECALEPAAISSNKAAPLALLLNELLINAYRHAFPEGRAGRIELNIARSGGELRIEIADDGVGMAESAGQAGFGLTIVDLLSRQLQARVVREDANPGVRVRIALPIEG